LLAHIKIEVTKQVIERLTATDLVAVVETQGEHTPQAKIASDTLCRSTMWTDKRFLLQMSPNGNAVHEMLERTLKTSAAMLTTIDYSLPLSSAVSLPFSSTGNLRRSL